MPQFDLNILNTQNINLLTFYGTYLFYVMNFFNIVYYYIKNSYKLLITLFLYTYKEIIHLIFISSLMFYMLLYIIKVRLLLNIFLIYFFKNINITMYSLSFFLSIYSNNNIKSNVEFKTLFSYSFTLLKAIIKKFKKEWVI